MLLSKDFCKLWMYWTKIHSKDGLQNPRLSGQFRDDVEQQMHTATVGTARVATTADARLLVTVNFPNS